MQIRSSRALGALVISFGLVASACSSSGEAKDDDTQGGDSSTEQTVANPCAPEGDETVPKALVRCGDESIAYVGTEIGNGTGIVIVVDDERYLLTNAHVIDPFAAADVIVAKETYEAMPVIGVDLVSDIAVLGPFDDDAELNPIPLTTGAEVERGDDAYVIGFPGELFDPDPDDLEPTIARGIMGRTRNDKDFDLTYFQSDASITNGQSGGGLFDLNGNLIGVTGMSWAEEYTLAVSASNVLDSVTAILDGDSDVWSRLIVDPESDELETELTIAVEAEIGMPALWIPPAAKSRDVELRFDHSDAVAVEVNDLFGEPIAASANILDHVRNVLSLSGMDQLGTPEELMEQVIGEIDDSVLEAEVEPGVLEFTIPADTGVSVQISSLTGADAVDLTVSSSAAFQFASTGFGTDRVDVGDSVDVVIDASTMARIIEVELDEGDTIEVSAVAAAEDLALAIIGPDGPLLGGLFFGDVDGAEFTDDELGGPLENRETTEYTAEVAGVHRIVVHTFSGYTTLARVTVEAA